MSIENKIKNAKQTDWVAKGIPEWQVKLIVFAAKLKYRIKNFLGIEKQKVDNSVLEK